MRFRWDYVLQIAPSMLRASIITLEVTLVAMGIACMLGLLVAACRGSRSHAIASAALIYVEILRSVPVLIQVYYWFFVLPLLGLTFNPFAVGIIGLGIYYSTFTAEVYRAGIEGVPRGQWEAALALNMTPFRTMKSVILPQAIEPLIPPLGNYLIEMFKATPILATIGIRELLGEGQQLAADTFRYPEVYFWIAVVFLGLSYPSSLFVRWLERRVSLATRMARSLVRAEGTIT